MRWKWMAILMVVGVDLRPPSTAAQGSFVEVTFYCPNGMEVAPNPWKESNSSHYIEAGKTHQYTLRRGMFAWQYPGLAQIRQVGKRITCDYRTASNAAGYPTATYSYEVHREVVSCSPYGQGLTCKLKP